PPHSTTTSGRDSSSASTVVHSGSRDGGPRRVFDRSRTRAAVSSISASCRSSSAMPLPIAPKPISATRIEARYSVGSVGSVTDLRRDVGVANRIVHLAGLVTGFGHVSARMPGTQTFVFPTRASPALAQAERLLVMDTDGHVLEGEGEPNTEFWIHARIYAA